MMSPSIASLKAAGPPPPVGPDRAPGIAPVVLDGTVLEWIDPQPARCRLAAVCVRLVVWLLRSGWAGAVRRMDDGELDRRIERDQWHGLLRRRRMAAAWSPPRACQLPGAQRPEQESRAPVTPAVVPAGDPWPVASAQRRAGVDACPHTGPPGPAGARLLSALAQGGP